MRKDLSEDTAQGFTRYVQLVGQHLGEETLVVDSDPDDELATAIILVASRLPTLPDQAVVLAWDEVNGWALRITIDDDGDTTSLSYLGEEIMPAPPAIRDFLNRALLGENPGSVHPPEFRIPNQDDGLERRLAGFVG